MEANRKRPLPSLSRTSSEMNAVSMGSKIRRPESPRKRPRTRSSGLPSRDPVKDLRSHRVFSPASDLSWDILNQKIGFENHCADTETDPIGKGNPGFTIGDRSFDNENVPTIDSDSKTKSIIRPCVRGKLFKTPGSVSYRRLLPYLINMSDTNSCDGKIDQSEKNLQKRDSNTIQEIVLDFVNGSFDGDKLKLSSSENVGLPQSTTGEDNCLSDAFESEPIQNDINLSSLPNNSESHMPVMVQNGDTEITASGSHLSKDDELCKDSEVQKGIEDGDVLNQVEDLNEEPNQMTPPDTEVLVRPLVEGNEADRTDYVLNPDNLNRKLSNGVNHEISSLVSNTRYDIDSKCKGVSKPRSQMKLFRNPGSFSYRRMLPFLTDIAKDNSDGIANGQLVKPEDLERPELLASDNQDVPLDQSNLGFVVNQKDCFVTTTDNGNQISTVNGTKIEAAPTNAEAEELFQVKEVVSGVLTDAEPKSREFAIPKPSRVTSKAEAGFNSLKPVEADKPNCLFSSRIVPTGRPRKGILKRNPRGCRGLCTCLNCASFRLHAERAFEFSRNQMDESEEMVLELVNELSYLRSILEKSADLVHDHHAIYIDQVKEACKKACEAEEQAKGRLDQMNYDLGVHCRITCLERPRVTFVNRVEENLCPKTN